jgi:hypothetical protein
VRISPSDENDHPSSAREDAQSVLANLPRARPQRSTPRRTAARKARGGASAAEGEAAAAPERPAARETIPRQGFECEGDGTRGSIQPPGASELVASAVEMVGELAKAGASRGERLLKDVLSRLSP